MHSATMKSTMVPMDAACGERRRAGAGQDAAAPPTRRIIVDVAVVQDDWAIAIDKDASTRTSLIVVDVAVVQYDWAIPIDKDAPTAYRVQILEDATRGKICRASSRDGDAAASRVGEILVEIAPADRRCR